MKFFGFLSCLFLLVTGCTDTEQPERLTNRPVQGLYGDYQVWSEEESDDVTIRIQFRRGSAEGEVVPVGAEGHILLDGEAVPADSTQFAGVYYEIIKSLEEFSGPHTIQFTDENGSVHKEEFIFEPFTLEKEMPANIRKKPFQIRLQNFPDAATQVRLVMVDTALFSTDVNEEIFVEDGIVDVTEEHLAELTSGPVTIEIYREEERLVSDGRFFRARFTMSFGLRRQINLVH